MAKEYCKRIVWFLSIFHLTTVSSSFVSSTTSTLSAIASAEEEEESDLRCRLSSASDPAFCRDSSSSPSSISSVASCFSSTLFFVFVSTFFALAPPSLTPTPCYKKNKKSKFKVGQGFSLSIFTCWMAIPTEAAAAMWLARPAERVYAPGSCLKFEFRRCCIFFRELEHHLTLNPSLLTYSSYRFSNLFPSWLFQKYFIMSAMKLTA